MSINTRTERVVEDEDSIVRVWRGLGPNGNGVQEDFVFIADNEGAEVCMTVEFALAVSEALQWACKSSGKVAK